LCDGHIFWKTDSPHLFPLDALQTRSFRRTFFSLPGNLNGSFVLCGLQPPGFSTLSTPLFPPRHPNCVPHLDYLIFAFAPHIHLFSFFHLHSERSLRLHDPPTPQSILFFPKEGAWSWGSDLSLLFPGPVDPLDRTLLRFLCLFL